MKAALNSAKNNATMVLEDDFKLAINSIIASKKANTNSSKSVITKSEIIDEKDVPLSIREKTNKTEVSIK